MQQRSGRILLNGRFLSAPETGVQRYAREVTLRLLKEVTLVTPRRAARGLLGHLWEQFVLSCQLQPNDLLWSPANTGPLAVANHVVTIHDLSAIEHPEWYTPAFSAWYRFLLPRLAQRVKAIITVSEFSKRRMIEILGVPPEKVTVIPNGVSDAFTPREEAEVEACRRKYSLPEKYVLCLRGRQMRKNPRRLLRAWEIVRANFPEVTLVIAGEEDPVTRRVRLPQMGAVTVLGRVAEVDLPALYSGAAVFVFPSLYEGFGLPALEAMACDTPVIASRCGALPEVVGEAGVLVDPEDPDQIADAVQGLLSDSDERERLKVRGRAQAGRFSWGTAAEKTWQVLSCLLEQM